MFCNQCGSRLFDTASFCQRCGHKTQAAATTEEISDLPASHIAKPLKHRLLKGPVLVLISLCIFSLFVVLLIHHDPAPSTDELIAGVQSLQYPDLSKTTFLGINHIEGAYYDTSRRELILVGIYIEGKPPISLDDVLTIQRALSHGKVPTVSIDIPTFTLLASPKLNLQVKYQGGIEGTHFGAVLLEVDRRLKVLAVGRDNYTEELLFSQVPGHLNMRELFRQAGLERVPPHRLQITPEEVRVLVSEDAQGILLEEPQFRVDFIGPTMAPHEEQVAQRFTRQINSRLEEYYAEEPVFTQFLELVKLASILVWVQDYGIPVPWEWSNDYDPSPFKTFTTIPSAVEQETFGGVLFRIVNNYTPASSSVEPITSLRTACQKLERWICAAGGLFAIAVNQETLAVQDYFNVAREGAAEETSYIGKYGRAGERVVMLDLQRQGEAISDVNIVIQRNFPIIDIASDYRLVSVKTTISSNPSSRVSYLLEGFDDLYLANEVKKREDAARNLIRYSDRLNLPSEFLSLFQDNEYPKANEIAAGAEYIQRQGQLWIPIDIYGEFISEIKTRIELNSHMYGLSHPHEIDGFLNSHVFPMGITTEQLRQIVENGP
jgi:hypothetical protein